MKKNVLLILIGIIIGIGATAYALNASEIDYKNDKSVEEAIDDLYGKVKPTYTGSTTVTPTTTEQTLSTSNKMLTNDIVINAIPSNYKDLSTASDFSASDLLLGKKAYNSNGVLVEGTFPPTYTPNVIASQATLSRGTLIANRNGSITLNKGDYVVVAVLGIGMGGASASQDDYTFDAFTVESTSANKTIQTTKLSMDTHEQVNVNSRLHIYYATYHVVVNNDSTTVKVTSTETYTDNTNPQMLGIQAIKID